MRARVGRCDRDLRRRAGLSRELACGRGLTILEFSPFRQRVALEIERTRAYHRPLTLVANEEVRDLEYARMQAALRATDGHQRQAAELIAMPLRTFQTKAKLYGVSFDARKRR